MSFYYGNEEYKYITCGGSGHYLSTAGKRTPRIPELEGRVIHEYEFNQPVKIKMFEGLKRCGIACFDSNKESYDVPLNERAKRANKLIKNESDLKRIIYVSIHFNAWDGKFGSNKGGISIYHYPTSTNGKKLATTIYNQLIQGTKQRKLGILTAKFAILKYTKMPAVLSENGFMDVLEEALLMLSEEFQSEVAEEHVKGICNYFGVKYIKPVTPKDKLYRVQVGAFKNLENAEKLVERLNKAGFNSIIKF